MASDTIKRAILARIQSLTFKSKVTGAKLGKPYGLDSQQVRRIINYYRSEPQCLPIGSNSVGYWWMTEHVHFEITDVHLESRIIGIQNARSGLKKARRRFMESKEGKLL